MTGFLNLDLLRAYEVPVLPRFEAGHGKPRPRLAAAWQLSPDGRPVCRWRIDETDPAG